MFLQIRLPESDCQVHDSCGERWKRQGSPQPTPSSRHVWRQAFTRHGELCHDKDGKGTREFRSRGFEDHRTRSIRRRPNPLLSLDE